MKMIAFFKISLLLTSLVLNSCADFSLTQKNESTKTHSTHNYLKDTHSLFQNKQLEITFFELYYKASKIIKENKDLTYLDLTLTFGEL